MAGKTFAVTGASKGMGLRFARALAREGAQVALLARPSPELQAAGREIAGSLALECDVASRASVETAFAQIRQRFGTLHGLVNNAAAILLHRIDNSTDEEIQRGIAVNLVGPINCIRAAVPLLRASGCGDIVNVSSDSVETPMPFMSIYGATKAALENLSDSLRVELRADGIRVMVLRSGRISSGGNLGAHWDPERAKEYEAAKARMNHPIVTAAPVSPETMAEMLVQMLRLPREASIDLMELRPS